MEAVQVNDNGGLLPVKRKGEKSQRYIPRDARERERKMKDVVVDVAF